MNDLTAAVYDALEHPDVMCTEAKTPEGRQRIVGAFLGFLEGRGYRVTPADTGTVELERRALVAGTHEPAVDDFDNQYLARVQPDTGTEALPEDYNLSECREELARAWACCDEYRDRTQKLEALVASPPWKRTSEPDTGNEALRAALQEVVESWEAAIKVQTMPAPIYRASVLDAMSIWPKGANGPVAIAAYEALVERLNKHRAVVSAAALWLERAEPVTPEPG